LYAIELGWPSGGEAIIHALGIAVGGQKIESVDLLGSDTKLQFQQKLDGLHIQLPAQDPGKYAYAFRVRFEGTTE
jgi:alpha-L-fucosidase